MTQSTLEMNIVKLFFEFIALETVATMVCAF